MQKKMRDDLNTLPYIYDRSGCFGAKNKYKIFVYTKNDFLFLSLLKSSN